MVSKWKENPLHAKDPYADPENRQYYLVSVGYDVANLYLPKTSPPPPTFRILNM